MKETLTQRVAPFRPMKVDANALGFLIWPLPSMMYQTLQRRPTPMNLTYLKLLLSPAIILAALASTLCSADEVLTIPLPGSPKIESSFGSQPLAFERNVGQADSAVQFLARGPGYQLFLTESEAVMVLPESRNRNADFPVGEFGRLENRRYDAEANQRRMGEALRSWPPRSRL